MSIHDELGPATIVPPEFLCPIASQIMQCPVILCTGITYERWSIEKWFAHGHRTCPVTMQHLPTCDFVPNVVLAKIIQFWCSNNYSLNKSANRRSILNACSSSMLQLQQVRLIVDDVQKEHGKLDALQKLEIKVKGSERYSKLVVEANAIPILGAVLISSFSHGVPFDPASEHALAILSLLPIGDTERSTLSSHKCLESISKFLHEGSTSQSKLDATVLLENLAKSRDLKLMIGSISGLFQEFTRLLQQNYTETLTLAILRAVMGICLPTINIVKALESGMTAAIVELLPNAQKGLCEHALALLGVFTTCAEGRAAISQHPKAIPAIAAKIFQISSLATHSAVSCLLRVQRYSPEDSHVQERVTEACQVAKSTFRLLHDEGCTVSSPKHLVVKQFLRLCSPKLRNGIQQTCGS
ncbi:hypothetical protein O6H91_10G036800 [Diphasiastrum complanatum]|uniref:Uncharacterized protein n=1 Tax=Diphasiastrum complanatum TaxID=34168 RepID=A0ACC2CFW5_DIPCM|nr:hypothetical protein O6H91_10G036800 [Diphasiastrum complanatum]